MRTETAKTEIEKPTGLVRSDLNLEKWNIFTTRMKQGYRVLKRESTLADGSVQIQVVKIGLKGATESLTTEEALIFYAVLDLWEVQGRPADGIVRTTYGHLLNRLIQKGETRRGTWSKEWLKEKLSVMRRIPIEFGFFGRKDGSAEMNVSFTLFSDSLLWGRDEAKEKTRSGLSYIKIHPTIVKNLLEHHVKPVRFDVLVTLKKDISRILYRYLDLMLFDKTCFERDIRELAVELDIGAERFDNLLAQFRCAFAELEGKELSNGRLEICRLGRRADGVGWKLIARKGKQVTAPPTLEGRPTADDDTALVVGEEVRERELLAFYESMSERGRAEIEARKTEIIKTKFAGWFSDMTEKMARLDALEEAIKTAQIPLFQEVS